VLHQANRTTRVGESPRCARVRIPPGFYAQLLRCVRKTVPLPASRAAHQRLASTLAAVTTSDNKDIYVTLDAVSAQYLYDLLDNALRSWAPWHHIGGYQRTAQRLHRLLSGALGESRGSPIDRAVEGYMDEATIHPAGRVS